MKKLLRKIAAKILGFKPEEVDYIGAVFTPVIREKIEAMSESDRSAFFSSLPDRVKSHHWMFAQVEHLRAVRREQSCGAALEEIDASRETLSTEIARDIRFHSDGMSEAEREKSGLVAMAKIYKEGLPVSRINLEELLDYLWDVLLNFSEERHSAVLSEVRSGNATDKEHILLAARLARCYLGQFCNPMVLEYFVNSILSTPRA